MASAVARIGGGQGVHAIRLERIDRRLLWAVREPFISKSSRADMVAGILADGNQLTIESLMPESGVIFSDGMEADFLPFNTGTIARIGASRQTAKFVVA